MYQTLKSIWLSVVGMLFMQFEMLDDEIKQFASPRRFWITILSSFAVFWIIAGGGYAITQTLNISLFFTLGMYFFCLSILPLMAGCLLTTSYLKSKTHSINQLIAIVMAGRLLIFAFLTLAQMIVYTNQFHLNATNGFVNVLNLLNFNVIQFFTISGLRIFLDASAGHNFSLILFGLSLMFLVVSGYLYWILYKGLRILFPRRVQKELLISMLILFCCVDVLSFLVYSGV